MEGGGRGVNKLLTATSVVSFFIRSFAYYVGPTSAIKLATPFSSSTQLGKKKTSQSYEKQNK